MPAFHAALERRLAWVFWPTWGMTVGGFVAWPTPGLWPILFAFAMGVTVGLLWAKVVSYAYDAQGEDG